MLIHIPSILSSAVKSILSSCQAFGFLQERCRTSKTSIASNLFGPLSFGSEMAPCLFTVAVCPPRPSLKVLYVGCRSVRWDDA